MNLDAPRVLVLNATYEVLGLASIKRSVLLVLGGGAEMVAESGLFLHTPSTRIPVPSVIRLKRLVRRGPSRVPLNRRNVLRRDRYTCQYCGRQGGDLTVDHVLPKSRGGEEHLGEPGGRLPGLQPEKGGPHPRGGGHAPPEAAQGAQGAPFFGRP